MFAVGKAIAMAKENGVGLVGIKHSNHFGAAAYYCMKIMEAGMIGFSLSNAPATMVPFGGANPYFGTNPLAFAVPAKDYPPIVLDMATSVVARGHIILAEKGNKPIPEGWAIDSQGWSTTDPKAALEGAVLPVGGQKALVWLSW